MPKPSSTKTLYHVTHSDNLKGILQGIGIDPDCATGRSARAYYVDKQSVAWAIAHVCAKHKCFPEHIVVLRIKAKARDFTRVVNKHIYFTQKVYRPYAVDGAHAFLIQDERMIAMMELIENGEFWTSDTGS
jgi:hypothetical protein